MSFMPNGAHPARVGDEDEIAPDCWDCFQCTASIDVTGKPGDKVTCPRCGAEYEVTGEVRRVRLQYVQLTKRGEDSRPRTARMVMNNPWGHGSIAF